MEDISCKHFEFMLFFFKGKRTYLFFELPVGKKTMHSLRGKNSGDQKVSVHNLALNISTYYFKVVEKILMFHTSYETVFFIWHYQFVT